MARPKGSKNKAPIAFRERLRLYCEANGVDPFEFLVDCLKKPKLDNAHKINCAKELAKYLEPQLRSMEMSGKDGGPIALQDLDAAQRLDRLEALLLKRNGHAVPLTPTTGSPS